MSMGGKAPESGAPERIAAMEAAFHGWWKRNDHFVMAGSCGDIVELWLALGSETEDLNPKFDAMRNAIYHTSRRRFFELLSRTLSFLVVVSGTAAVANLQAIEPRFAAAGAATIGALQLVFDFNGRARTHEILQRKYYDLLADIDGIQKPNDEQIVKWQSALNRIYADEPPPMRALDAIAYNAACRNMGYDTRPKRVNIFQLALSHIYPFPNTDFSANASA